MSPAALMLYDVALRRAALGQAAGLRLVDRIGGTVRAVDAADWSAGLRPGDDTLLLRCPDRTIDLGCGPGRFVGALVATGRQALGVDVSPEAVRHTRRRGAPALLGDLFRPLPDEGDWHCALLVDGNIGIGGDPERLLRRCRSLLRTGGTVLVEVDPPGSRTWQGDVQLALGSRVSASFAWAFVSADEIAAIADRAALRVLDTWTEAGRWFVHLEH